MERFKESLHIALNNLLTNAVRSFLSVLGVVIGIAAVITVLSIGAGAKQHILSQINSMGVNVYTINARYDETTQRMGEFDLEDIRRINEVPSVLTALPKLNLYKLLRSRAGEQRGVIVGVNENYLTAQNLVVTKGRNFAPIEMEERSPVCMVNASGEKTLFPSSNDNLGQSIFIDDMPWKIVGIYTEKSSQNNNAQGSGEIEVLIAMNALLRNIKDISIQSLEVHIKPEKSASAKEDLLAAIERGDEKRKGLFSVRDQREYYSRSLEIQGSLSLIGVLVAGISLIVGGIGMMNVMLTSVAERTREIGIRRAVGARKKDILFQFLVESCVLSVAGGMLGLLFGAALARGLPLIFKEFFNIAPQMQPSFLVLAVGAGMLLGVSFGFYPAIKASKLSPAEALRTE